MRTGYIVFAHGSRLEEANEAVRQVAAELARAGGFELVETAFLDCTPPDLMEAVGKLAERGVERIVVLPFFLTLGRHAAQDLPRIAAEASRIHKGVRVEIAPGLEGHPALIEALLDSARSLDEGLSEERDVEG